MLAKVWEGIEPTRSTIRTVYSQEKNVKEKEIYLRFLYLGLSSSSKSCNFVKVKSLQLEVAIEEIKYVKSTESHWCLC